MFPLCFLAALILLPPFPDFSTFLKAWIYLLLHPVSSFPISHVFFFIQEGGTIKERKEEAIEQLGKAGHHKEEEQR